MTETSDNAPKPLWTHRTLASVCDGEIDGTPIAPITGISIDTRTLQPGDLFVALTDQRDGHAYLPAAFQAGASAALVAKTYVRNAGDGVLIRVEDPLRALEDAGRSARFRADAKIVAVTGSVGKTGTKEMLRACLSRTGHTHASEKSYNNHWGVPLTLARMPVETHYGVFEIGMNRPGEIGPLARMVAPDVGVITTVAPVHLAQFKSVTEIAEAKAELLTGLSSGGTAILNRDNHYFDLLSVRADERSLRIVGFGHHKDADVRLETAEVSDTGSVITAHVHGRRITYRIGAPGNHYVMNSLAVIAAIDALGADLEVCLPALAGISPPPGRGARSEITVGNGKLLLIDESYNANPASMAAALANLGVVPRGQYPRRIAVIGDMRELGSEADALHRGLKDAIDAAGIDLVFACGEHMRTLYDLIANDRRGAYARTSLELVPLLAARLAAGDAVTVKGSLGTNMAPLVKVVRDAGTNPNG